MAKMKLVVLQLEILTETEKTIRVENMKGESVWLPKSLIEIDGETITMPEALAIEKELI